MDALYQRGSTAHKLGQLEAAIADFSAVLSLDPNHAKAAYSRAACNNLAGRFDDANGALRSFEGSAVVVVLCCCAVHEMCVAVHELPAQADNCGPASNCCFRSFAG